MGVGVRDDQFPTFDQLSLNLLKSQSPIPRVWGMAKGIGDDQFPTFDAESKSAEIPKSNF